MTFSFPSFCAAATRALSPPPAWADEAVAQLALPEPLEPAAGVRARA